METVRTRLIVGGALMLLGFAAVLVMLSGLIIDERPPSWLWGMVLWIGAGSAIVISAFVAVARDRRERTAAALRSGPLAGE